MPTHTISTIMPTSTGVPTTNSPPANNLSNTTSTVSTIMPTIHLMPTNQPSGSTENEPPDPGLKSDPLVQTPMRVPIKLTRKKTRSHIFAKENE